MKTTHGYSIDNRHDLLVNRVTQTLPAGVDRRVLTEFLLDHANFWAHFKNSGAKAEYKSHIVRSSRQCIVSVASILACIEFYGDRPALLRDEKENSDKLKLLEEEISVRMRELATREPDFHKEVNAVKGTFLAQLISAEEVRNYIEGGAIPQHRNAGR